MINLVFNLDRGVGARGGGIGNTTIRDPNTSN